MWAADNIASAICLFYPLYCDIISLISLKITQAFHLFLGCAENWTVFWDFYIHDNVWITEGLDNGDSDNRGSTVHITMLVRTCTHVHTYLWCLDGCLCSVIASYC